LGALVAFSSGTNPQLCEFDIEHFQPELKTDRIWYGAMGSGQLIVDPFLGLFRKVFWNDGLPSRQDATFAVTWAIQMTIDLNAGGVNGPISIATLFQKKGHYEAAMLTDDEINDHLANVDGMIEHIRNYGKEQRGDSSDAVEIPVPQ